MKLSILIFGIISFFSANTVIPERNAVLAASFSGRAYATSQMMDFTDSTEAEVDAYYGDIGSRVGDDLKSYLYQKISANSYYVTYKGVTDYYKITDRNWELSRNITPKTYLFTEDVDNNFYETLLYFKDITTEAKQINTDVNSYTSSNSITAVDWVNHLRPKKQGDNDVQVDKEHVWVKSHGFSPSGTPCPGAGTDLHHLIAADHNSNNIHNNLYYGNVVSHNTATVVYCLYGDGTRDVSGWVGNSAYGETVFEPTDQWKGNIARALLYMGTRFSVNLGTNTEEEPYLYLTDDVSKADDNSHYIGVFHNLSTFLEWNELDPVDNYEIHRNNLIYKNVQRNRNPYVDHPEWARRVYDSSYQLGGVTDIENSSTKAKLSYHYSITNQSTVTDTLNSTLTGVSGSSYTSFSNRPAVSGASYSGKCAASYSSIQLRTEGSDAGVYVSNSIGTLKSIKFIFNTNTASGRTVNLYGKNTGYSSASDLFVANQQGTLIGSATYNGTREVTLIPDKHYLYFGFRSNYGALYLDSVEVEWDLSIYSYSNVKIRFGGLIDQDIWAQFRDRITNYGVMIASETFLNGDTIKTAYQKGRQVYDSSYINQERTVIADPNLLEGSDDYLFNTVINFEDNTSKFTTVYHAAAYVVLDGNSYVFLQEKSCSVGTLANEYLTGDDPLPVDSYDGSLEYLGDIYGE